MLNFSLPNVDDRMVSLADYPDAKGFIVIFTCNHCPYAIAYEDRIKALDEYFTPKGFPLIAISSNDPVKYPQDSFDNMKVRARDKGFGFPYVFDGSQDIARNYQAERTPHAYVLVRQGEKLNIVYKGAIDDNYQNPKAVKEQYLKSYVEALLAGQSPAYTETAAVGCSMKWK